MFNRGPNKEFILTKNMNIGTLISKNKFELKNAEFLVHKIEKNVDVVVHNAVSKISGTVGENSKIELTGNSTILINKAYLKYVKCPEGRLFDKVDDSTMIISSIQLVDKAFYEDHKDHLLQSNAFSNYSRIDAIGDGADVNTSYVFSNSVNNPSKWSNKKPKINHFYHPYHRYGSASSSSSTVINNPPSGVIEHIGTTKINNRTDINRNSFVPSIGNNNSTMGEFKNFSYAADGAKISIINNLTNESITKAGNVIQFLENGKFNIDGNIFDWEALKLAATLEESCKSSFKL